MPKTYLKPNDSIDSALRRFKRAVEKSGVLTKVRRCQFYEKPSTIRKREKAAAVKRYQKKLMRETGGGTGRFQARPVAKTRD